MASKNGLSRPFTTITRFFFASAGPAPSARAAAANSNTVFFILFLPCNATGPTARIPDDDSANIADWRPRLQCLVTLAICEFLGWWDGNPVAILELTDISKHFGAIHALDDVSLQI